MRLVNPGLSRCHRRPPLELLKTPEDPVPRYITVQLNRVAQEKFVGSIRISSTSGSVRR